MVWARMPRCSKIILVRVLTDLFLIVLLANQYIAATVRYELDHIHTFEFPEGCVNCDIAPGTSCQIGAAR